MTDGVSIKSYWNTEFWIPEIETPCKNKAELFGTIPTSSTLRKQVKLVCMNECPCTDICLETALAEEEFFPMNHRSGFRGGLTPKERHQLTKENKINALTLKESA